MLAGRTPSICPRCGKPKRDGYRKRNGLWLPDDPLRRPLLWAGLAGPPPLGYFQPVGDDRCGCGCPICRNIRWNVEVRLSDFVNEVCGNCADINGTFVLDPIGVTTPTQCTWR